MNYFSATSIYNAQETVNVETEQEYDEKRRADDQKTKQKMDAIRSKLKTRSKKVSFNDKQNKFIQLVTK